MRAEATSEPDDGRTLLEYAQITWKRRRLVACCAVACGVLGLVFGFVRSRKYESTAIISPPQQGSGGILGRLAVASPEIVALAGSMLGEGASTKMYTDILGSRHVREGLAREFDLARVYDAESPYLAARRLEKRSKHKVTHGGLVTVTDTDPELAAKLANGYVKELNGLLARLNVTQASREREFLEKRLAAVAKDLSKSEDALRVFQETHGTLSIGESARSLMEVYGKLKN